MNSADVRAALRNGYKQPEWALFFEVADGTGMNKRRTADGILMNMYPSRGLTVHGLEFKVSRSDWTRELRDPDKAESIARFCDLWSVVAPKGLIDSKELPRTWGLIEVDGTATRIKTQASERKATPLTRSFVASLVRSVAKVDENVVANLVNAQVAKALEDRQKRIDDEVDRRTREAKEIVERHAAFAKSIAGFRGLGSMNEAKIIRAIEIVHELGLLDEWSGLRRLIFNYKAAGKAFDRIAEELNIKEEL